MDSMEELGLFRAGKDFGSVFNHSIPPALFFFFFLSGEKLTVIPLFTPGSVNSGSASWDDCGKVFTDKLRVSLFQDRFPNYAQTAA